jgi:hypothetical protein
MLQKQTVSPKLLELLDKIMKSEIFSDFLLVGGTSLALQIGHRESVDIDMFGNIEILETEFLSELSNYGDVTVLKKSRNILITAIDGIKVDFVNYKYPLLDSFLNIENVRLISKKDVAAMKLNAIAGRGSKKDFIDLFFLLQEFSLTEMLNLYNKKFSDGSEFMVIKSLCYFTDADLEQTPVMYEEFDWENCKKVIREQVKQL